jgi:hypothetical protein
MVTRFYCNVSNQAYTQALHIGPNRPLAQTIQLNTQAFGEPFVGSLQQHEHEIASRL